MYGQNTEKSLGKVIFKTALKALAAVLAALIIAFAVMSLAFPRTMAGIFESLGDYAFATGYASLSYTYTGDPEDLARCVDDSMLAYNDGNIISYGESLIQHEKFGEICAARDEAIEDFDYRQVVYGNVAAAKYRTGDKNGAIQTAQSALEDGTFPAGNAFGTLALAVIKADDGETAQKIIDGLPAAPQDEEELDYYNKIINALKKLTDEGEV